MSKFPRARHNATQRDALVTMPGFMSPFKRKTATDTPRSTSPPTADVVAGADVANAEYHVQDEDARAECEREGKKRREDDAVGEERAVRQAIETQNELLNMPLDGAPPIELIGEGEGGVLGDVFAEKKSSGVLNEIQNEFGRVMERAERAKRISDAQDIAGVAQDLQRCSNELYQHWNDNELLASQLALDVSRVAWNFAVEKTALETKVTNEPIDDAFRGPLLDIRYCSCDLLDHASGFISGFTVGGAREHSILAVGITNHLKLACLMHDAGELKASEEQFGVAESYMNLFLNNGGQLTDEELVLTFEATLQRAVNSFLLGDVQSAKSFFDDAKRYIAQSTRGKNSEDEIMLMTSLVSAKVNVAENLSSHGKPSPNVNEQLLFVINSLADSYGDLFKVVRNSWSTDAHVDDHAEFAFDLSISNANKSLKRSDGLFIRILYQLSKAYILAREYGSALRILHKLKTIKSYVKSCTTNDQTLSKDLHALTETFSINAMLIEALSGIGNSSQACEVLEDLLCDESSTLDDLRSYCVKLAKMESGAGIVAKNIGNLLKRTSVFAISKRQELVTDILEALLETAVAADDAIGGEIIRNMEAILTDSALFRETGLTRDGKSRAYAVIWNAASDMYMQNKYGVARILFGMTLPLSAHRKSKKANDSLSSVVRLQIMCDLESGDVLRAQESLQSLTSEIVSNNGTLDISTRLLHAKLKLATDDISGLGEIIESLGKEGESSALLYVAGELDATEHHAVAADAFQKLYDTILDGAGTDELCQQETFVFCSYLRHLKASHQGKLESKKMTHVCEMFNSFMKRAMKQEALLENTSYAQYLADYSWNIGLDAYHLSASEMAYKFMFVSAFVTSKLKASLDEIEASDYGFRQAVALVLAITSLSTLEDIRGDDDVDMSPKSKHEAKALRIADNMKRCKGAMSQLRAMLKNTTEERYNDLKHMANVLEYEIACAERNVGAQETIVTDFASKSSHDSGSISTLIMIADRGSRLRTSDLHVVGKAYDEALNALLNQCPNDSQTIARVLRRRIQLAARIYKANDQSLLSLYTKAEETAAVSPGYPPVEAQWLLSTCFNRAVRHERSMRTSMAIAWLKQTQQLLTALQSILPDAMERYKHVIGDNLIVLSLEQDES